MTGRRPIWNASRTNHVLCAAFLLAAPLQAQSRIPLAFRDSAPTWLAAAHVPALAVAVIEGGNVTAIQTFGELRPGVPLSPRALFNVASLTKPIVAVTTLRLASAGTLDLDAPLDPDWIDPDIKNDPRHSKLTARIILSHQTGFPNWRSHAPNGKLAFLFDPGTKFGYSGEGFEYLRHALQHKYSRTLQQLADSILFRPLHMTETTFGWNPRADTALFAFGHDTSGKLIVEGKRTMDDPNAADWLVTTIGDYSKFGEFVLHGAGMSRAAYADMTKPQAQMEGKPGEAMGLGWEVMTGPADDPVILMHTGSDDGIKTMILLLPKSQRGLVMFTNGERGFDVMMKILKSTLHMKELTP
ncbi:MAG TPA: serine hydrolase domain-containing protein [Gemmatimonadaceae bacterium]|jgi:CubicO group peptidase (beta-lactamase class C family)|nr:serine hydrolase domain-containing protein [Gemmatimonadaceae bacterium]